MTSKEKIPQTIQALIGDIGEGLVIFKLYELVHDKPNFEVFKNFSEPGYDCGIRNVETGAKIKVEVKTRQRLITTSDDKHIVHFTLTQNEKDHADFLVGYWLEHNDYFIIPVDELNEQKSGKKFVYKHIVSRNRNESYGKKSIKYLNEWKFIKSKF